MLETLNLFLEKFAVTPSAANSPSVAKNLSREERKILYEESGFIVNKSGNIVELSRRLKDKQNEIAAKKKKQIRINKALCERRNNDQQYTSPYLPLVQYDPSPAENMYPAHLVTRLVKKSIINVTSKFKSDYYYHYTETQKKVNSVDFDNNERVIKTRIKYLLDDLGNMTEKFCWEEYLDCDYYGAECKEEDLQEWKQTMQNKYTEIKQLLTSLK